MSNDSDASTANEAPHLTNDKLYEMLIEELRCLHGTWIDNFRVILTFNSLLLPATVAVLVFISRGEIAVENVARSYCLLAMLSWIGILVTLVGICLIGRIKTITTLRHRQVRRLEVRLVDQCSVAPWIEGYCLFGGEIPEEIKNRGRPVIEMPKKGWFVRLNAFWGFTIIAACFVLAYLFIFVIAVSSIAQPAACTAPAT